jgi:hypothetical protein
MLSPQDHSAQVAAVLDMIRGCGPDNAADRERLLWSLVNIHAGALTPASENEKRGMGRVLAILDCKLGEGGWIAGAEGAEADAYAAFCRGRWSAFQEVAIMLRSALKPRAGEV